MKKINNNGMTLVELIVSFMLVSVAMLYFFQTLRTVQKIYTKSVEQTKQFVNFNYAFRIIEEADKNRISVNSVKDKIKSATGVERISITGPSSERTNTVSYDIELDGVTKVLYLYHE